MLALVALAATGSLLPYHPPKDGQRGVPATPDYSGIATRVANAVPIDSWINADLPAAAEAAAEAVVSRAEGGLRKMRAAYNSAPDYARISGALAAAGNALTRPAVDVVDRAESGLRKMRAAYNSAPDYAKISGAMAAGGIALMYSHGNPDVNGFASAAVESVSKVPFAQWKEAKEATPKYGAIAVAAALLGRSKIDFDDMRAAGLSM